MSFHKRKVFEKAVLYNKRNAYTNRHLIFSLIKKLRRKDASLKNILKNLDTQKEHNALRLEFIAHLAHEIKTPLNAIIGFASLMEERELSREKQIKFCKNIISASKHLLNITEATIDTSRAAANKISLLYSEFVPQSVIIEVLSILEEQIVKKHLHLITDFVNSIIMADQRRFKQLIFNLVSNAVKYNKVGGTIKIRTRTDGRFFRFEISDTGCGISLKERENVFEYFSGINKNSMKRLESTGIGLSLCKKIVLLHGGEINFESKVDEGSRFWFSLPVHPSSQIEKDFEYEKIKETL